MKINVGDKVQIRTTGEMGKVIQVQPHDGTETYVVDVNGTAYACLPDFIYPVHSGSETGVGVKEIIRELKEPDHLDFIRHQTIDKNAAIRRKVATEECFEQWNMIINAANNREMPNELKAKYNTAGQLMEDIIKSELDVINRR